MLAPRRIQDAGYRWHGSGIPLAVGSACLLPAAGYPPQSSLPLTTAFTCLRPTAPRDWVQYEVVGAMSRKTRVLFGKDSLQSTLRLC